MKHVCNCGNSCKPGKGGILDNYGQEKCGKHSGEGWLLLEFRFLKLESLTELELT